MRKFHANGRYYVDINHRVNAFLLNQTFALKLDELNALINNELQIVKTYFILYVQQIALAKT